MNLIYKVDSILKVAPILDSKCYGDKIIFITISFQVRFKVDYSYKINLF
jgi:hypothetical protein